MYRKQFSPPEPPVLRRLWLLILCLVLLPVLAQGQTTVAEWDFNTQQATTTTSIPANNGKTIGNGGGVGTILYTSVGGPNGSYAYALGWANGANSKYWVVNISTAGYGTLTLSSEQWSEFSFFQYQGPRDFKIQYSLDNITWTDVAGGSISCTVDNQYMKKGTLTNLALPAACANQASVYLRWIMSSNTGGNGSDPVSGGQNWIDNISIKGQSLGGGGNTPPTISAISNQSTNEDVPFGPLGFTVGDAETAAGSLVVTATSSNTALVPNGNISLGGSGASRNISITPASNASGTTTITVSVFDGTVSTTETFDLFVQAINDPPVLANLEASALSFTEDGAPINVTSTITVSDVDDTNMESATVSISNGFVSSEDVLSFTNTANISGSFAGGVLTLTGSDSKANYQAALRNVKYQNTNTGAPSTASRTLSFAVNDGSASSSTFTRALSITAVNDAPVLAGIEMTTLNFTEDSAPINVTSTITVSDVDDANMESATVSISSGFVSSEDVLSFTNTANITGSFAGGVLTLSGSDSKANYQTALRSVKYQNTNTATPSTASRTLSFAVNDGSASSSTLTRALSITAVNDAPVLAGIEMTILNFIEDSAPIIVTSTIVVTDVDDTNIEGAEVSINGFVPGEDVLSFTNTANITGNFAGGVLTLMGSDSKANYQAALRSVRYQNTNTILPNTGPRTVSFTVNDGDDPSVLATRKLTVTEVNDPPNAVAGLDQTASCVLPTGTMVNVDGSASFDIENDKLSYAWSENGTTFATTAVASTNLTPGVHTLTLTVNDGRGGTDADDLIVTLIPDVTPPVLTLPANMTFNANPGVCTFTDPGLAIGKATATDNCPYPVIVTSNAPGVYPKGQTIVRWTAMDASGNSTSGNQTITVLDAEAPMITVCPASVSVEGSMQNTAQVPNLIGQLMATDNCTSAANLRISQNPVGGTTVGAGAHIVTFTVIDESNNLSTCTTNFTVVRRVEIDPLASMVVVASACKQPVSVTRTIPINNSGGNFAGGRLQWTASTSASEIALITNSGYEGDDLVFTVSIGSNQTNTINRTITLNGWNSATSLTASNSPYTITVSLQIEPLGLVTVTQSVGASWTPFLNSNGQKIAEVKSNSGTISSFTVNAFACTYPPGLSRIRYVKRYFTMSSNASNPNVDVRLFYTNTEALGLITQPSALTIWQKPLYSWTNLGGTSNPYQNYVEANALTNLTGPFALAHNWFPKEDGQADEIVPATMTLDQNYPNPFNPTTTISYALTGNGNIELTVHDVLGREVARLAEGYQAAGVYRVQFDASALSAGVYSYTLRSGGTVISRQMQLIK
ncbi:MAG: HYR domain-containing protein [Bacteroidota bacterium]